VDARLQGRGAARWGDGSDFGSREIFGATRVNFLDEADQAINTTYDMDGVSYGCGDAAQYAF